MTGKLYFFSTIAFWLAVCGLALTAGLWVPREPGAARAKDLTIPGAELARHSAPGDCWLAIRGAVYGLSAYLPEHPSRPEVIEPWCGKEATNAYDTKTKGRPHSPSADELLAQYRIGIFGKAP